MYTEGGAQKSSDNWASNWVRRGEGYYAPSLSSIIIVSKGTCPSFKLQHDDVNRSCVMISCDVCSAHAFPWATRKIINSVANTCAKKFSGLVSGDNMG